MPPSWSCSSGRQRRHRVAQGDQPLRDPRLLGVLEQVLAALGLLDRGGVGEQAFQIAELLEQLRRGLDPDARHARHVVRSVAGEREDVAHLLRPDPEALDHLGAVDRFLLHRVVHLHALTDQLHQVLVGGDDDHLAAGRARLAGVGGDDVVGLVAVELDHRQAERLGRLAHHLELRHQVVGRLEAVRLVVGVDGVAKARLALVEHHQRAARPACPGPGGTACCRSRTRRRPGPRWDRSAAAARRTRGRCSPTRRSGRGGSGQARA